MTPDIRLVYYLMLKGDEWVCFECQDELAKDYLWKCRELNLVATCMEIITNRRP